MKNNYQNLSRKNQILAKNIVVIDGFSSSGKTLVAPVISHLKRSEQWQLNELYENISILNYFDEISKKSAIAILKNESDKNLHNLMLGRNVNFRPSDVSSPEYNNLHEKYYNRSQQTDEKKIINEITKKNPILPLHVHYIFGYTDFLFECFLDRLKLYIIVLRNPFFLIKTWIEGDWVNRKCSINKDVGLCFDYFGEEIPWYAKDYAEEYVEANDHEKSVLTVYNLYLRIFSMYGKLSKSDRSKTPEKYIDRICNSLNTERADNFEEIMLKLSIPRRPEKSNFISVEELIDEYKDFLSKNTLHKLRDLHECFVNFSNQIKDQS